MAAALIGGALLGAGVSEALKFVIEEVKKVKRFKAKFKDLASTLETLLPLTQKIESKQNELNVGVGDLQGLMDLIEKAQNLVDEAPNVGFRKKRTFSKRIDQINQNVSNFFEIVLPLTDRLIQLQIYGSIESLTKNMKVSAPTNFMKLCLVPKLNMVPIGLDCPLEKVKKMLFDDGMTSVVVSAPPGCGKTTLVTKLCHDEKIKGKFKHIFFCVVSSTHNFRKTTQDLLEHNGVRAPTSLDDTQAAVLLRELLENLTQKDNVLLVLDDVWPTGESFLKNFKIDIPNYKILVTSRFTFSSFGPTYQLEPLKDDDARALLIKWTSNPNTDEYNILLQKILKRCSGIPLIIEVIGSSLKNKSLTTWRDEVLGWSSGDTILDNEHVKDRLQSSVDALAPNLKECFLDMGSFHEDQKLRASAIFDIWAELYLLTSIRCMRYLENLASQNLLKLVPLGKNEHEDGFYNEILITQHDILRELAISQSQLEAHQERERLNLVIQGNTFPVWYKNLKQPIKARLLSICTDDAFSSTWHDMDFHNVEALVLNLSSSSYALPSFIAKMEKLKVLTIMNHGVHLAELRNFFYLTSLTNLRRIRLERATVTTFLDVPKLQLKSLEKLSLFLCSFGEVFYELEIDVSEALPKLKEIEIDCCSDLEKLPYWICQVVPLKILSISNCHKLLRLPRAIENLTNLEVLRLSSCISLSELPETTHRLNNMLFLDVSYCSGLKQLDQEIGKMKRLKKISMAGCWRCVLPDSIRNIENLEVKCDEATLVLWDRFKHIMKNLRLIDDETEHNLNWLEMF